MCRFTDIVEFENKTKHLLGAKKYHKTNKLVKKAMPKFFEQAEEIVETQVMTICSLGSTCFYYDFNFSACKFTDDQAHKIALWRRQRNYRIGPWIANKPSQKEILFAALLAMADISRMNVPAKI